MIKFAALALLFALPHTRQKNTEATLPVQDRIRLLKLSIQEQLKHIKTTDTVSLLAGENYDYVDAEKMPITPVVANDQRALDDRYKLPLLKTKKTTLEYGFEITTTPNMFQILESHNIGRSRNEKEKYEFEKPVETFYRKVLRRQMTDEVKDTPQAWLHCQDVITPYMTGTKQELGVPYMVDLDHRIVTRLIQLFTTNTTSHTKEEIGQIIYQVSELDLRFYQWTPEAIRKLFKAIIKGEKHTFARLIYGLRKLFREWHLDYRNVTRLLQDTRIFRPMCITDSGDQSSTKTSGGTRYTRPSSQSTPNSDNEDCNNRK